MQVYYYDVDNDDAYKCGYIIINRILHYYQIFLYLIKTNGYD